MQRSEEPPRRWRSGTLRIPRRSRSSAAVVSEFQRSRILSAALEEVSACGYEQTSVTAIVSRAGVSRKTFYELYESRAGCLHSMFEESVAKIAEAVAPLYVESEGRWSERVRSALGGLLAFLEYERTLGTFVLEYVLDGANRDPESREWLLEQLQEVVADGRSQAKEGHEVSPLTAEIVVGGVLAVLHARLQARTRDLPSLTSALMWMIVLPYLGPAAAAKELRRDPPKPVLKRVESPKDALEGLDMRVTYRTARVLAAIEQRPGRSNVEIGTEVEIVDAGQMSKLLNRLEGFGLIENSGAGHAYGAANAWQLTPRGMEVDAAIRHQFVGGEPPRRSR